MSQTHTKECEDRRERPFRCVCSWETTRLRKALAPFADFAKRFDAMPLGGLDDDLYVIHAGTEWEASIQLSSLRAAARALEQTVSDRYERMQELADLDLEDYENMLDKIERQDAEITQLREALEWAGLQSIKAHTASPSYLAKPIAELRDRGWKRVNAPIRGHLHQPSRTKDDPVVRDSERREGERRVGPQTDDWTGWRRSNPPYAGTLRRTDTTDRRRTTDD